MAELMDRTCNLCGSHFRSIVEADYCLDCLEKVKIMAGKVSFCPLCGQQVGSFWSSIDKEEGDEG